MKYKLLLRMIIKTNEKKRENNFVHNEKWHIAKEKSRKSRILNQPQTEIVLKTMTHRMFFMRETMFPLPAHLRPAKPLTVLFG